MAELCPSKDLFFKQISSTCLRLTSFERNLLFAIYLEELINSVEGLDLKDGKERIFTTFNEKWTLFWSKVGNNLVKQTWIMKYSDYIDLNYSHIPKEFSKAIPLRVEMENEKESETSITDVSLERCYCAQLEINKILITADVFSKSHLNDMTSCDDWNTLWEKHYNDQYKLNYTIFSKILTSLPALSELTVKDRHSSCIGILGPDYITIDCKAELRAFGLPTSFGKKRKRGSSLRLDVSQCNAGNLYGKTSNIMAEETSSCFSEINKTLCGIENVQNVEILQLIPPEIKKSNTLLKYWKKRFTLFSRFDEGIKLDKESWFSVTPEKVAKHIASRLKCPILLDAFCGSGGNTIQFAFTCDKVIAIDIDPIKISFAKHNAKIYGVEHKIDFIIGDFLSIYNKIYADAIFLSPPWGGPDYAKNCLYDVEEDLLPLSATKLINTCRKITSNICIYLPRNTNMQKGTINSPELLEAVNFAIPQRTLRNHDFLFVPGHCTLYGMHEPVTSMSRLFNQHFGSFDLDISRRNLKCLLRQCLG